MVVSLNGKGSMKYVIVAIFFGFIAIVCFVAYKQSLRDEAIIAGGVTAEATVTHVEEYTDSSDNRIYYYPCYEYVDENGVTYKGETKDKYISKDNAYSQIGSKIVIYIDGNGKSVPVGVVPNSSMGLVWVKVFSSVSGVMVVLFVLSKVREKRKLAREREKAENQAQSAIATAGVNTATTPLFKSKKSKHKEESHDDAYEGRFDD